MIIAMMLAATLPIATPSPQPGAVAVFIAGQSNAVGRGVQQPEDSIAEPNVYVIKQDGKTYPAVDPLSITVPSGFGYGRTLARTLIEAGFPEVWLLTCAVSSTSASSWANAAMLSATSAHLQWEPALFAAIGSWFYQDCLQEGLLARRLGIPIIAVAWHQGESGCASLAETNVRVARLTTIRDRFKADFPDSAFIGGELARQDTCAYLAQTNAATEAVSDAFVSSEGLSTNGDIHFDRASQEELGRRYAVEILGLTSLKPARSSR